jgi:hypothetical protein
MSADDSIDREASGEELARILAKRNKTGRARSTSILIAVLMVLIGVLIGVPLGRASAPAESGPAEPPPAAVD